MGTLKSESWLHAEPCNKIIKMYYKLYNCCNPLTPKPAKTTPFVILLCVLDRHKPAPLFTLSNTKQFYSLRESALGGKGLIKSLYRF